MAFPSRLARPLSCTTELNPVYGSAHAQVASAFGGVEPPSLPAGPSASSGGRTGRGDPPASSRETSPRCAARHQQLHARTVGRVGRVGRVGSR